MQTHWDISGRDVVPELAPGGTARDVGAAILHGMLLASGSEWKAPYDSVRSALKIRNKQVAPELQEQADQRFRTYKTLFRGLGILYDEDGVLQTTDLGNELRELLDAQYRAVDDYGRHLANAQRGRLARLVAPALARYQLASPISTSDFPPGTDIHPLHAIWRCMRALDGKLHWEELGRVLTRCLKDSEVDAAIETIREARQRQDYDLADPAYLDQVLGTRMPDAGADQSDRLDTWFSRAAFKGLLLEPRDRTDGYRHLNAEFLGIIDSVLEDTPSYNSTTDAADYVRWMGQVDSTIGPAPSTEPDAVVDAVVAKCRRFGHRQIVALVGPAGTGKTRAAQAAALILADGDHSRIDTVQFHAGFTYEEFIGGLVPAGGTFKPAYGALLQINKRALADRKNTHVLVIDELSRADIANVLGELLTYIEYRDRPFNVPVLGHEVAIAPNLVVLATMNPADRSVVNMDDAMIRRLRQVAIPPASSALREILVANGMEDGLRSQVEIWFEGLPSDTPFGHGLFVGVKSESDLHELWHESLRYFLERGGIATYPDPARIQGDFIWSASSFALSDELAAPLDVAPSEAAPQLTEG